MRGDISLILGFLALVSAQNYSELYRPQYHFTPPKNWINDPNGLLFHNGQYHMYYQYNPTGNVWGNISWGHAVSSDLVHWKELPIALSAFTTPPSGSLNEFFFSGSAVSDDNNTSGFGSGTRTPLVAMYTSYYPNNITLSGNQSIRALTQAQSIAYSTDDGLTWTEYDGNPVLPSPPSPYEDQWQNFRDPFVFRYEQGGYWVLVVSLAQLHKLLIYTSKDLKNWKHVSEFGPANAAHGVWECPGLFPLPLDGNTSQIKWVAGVGVQNGGPAFAASSAVQYFVGNFDGQNFTADSDNVYNPYSGGANWLDYGPDYYAVATYNGLANYSRVAIAWMSDWAYALVTPTFPWRSAMTVPRELSLQTIGMTPRLISTPIPNLQVLDSAPPVYSKQWNSTSAGTMTLPVSGKALDITLTFGSRSVSSMQLGLTVRSDGMGNGTSIGYDFPTSQMFVNRTASGNTSFSPSFSGIYYAPLPARNGNVKIRILLDWSSVEVFGGEGESTITAQIFPPDADTSISLFSIGEAKNVSIKIDSVASIWRS